MSDLVFEISSVYTPYLNVLADALGNDNTEFEIRCLEDDMGHYYHFASELLDNGEEPNTIYKNAAQLVQLLNGMLFLVYERPMGKVRLRNLFDDKKRLYYDEQQVSGQFDVEAFLKTKQTSRKRPIADVLELCKTDSNLRDLIFILGVKLEYNTLYMAFEAMGSIMGNLDSVKKLVGQELTTKLNEFTATANNYNAIGIQARHRKTSFDRPAKVMTIEEASDLIREVAHLVIEHQYGIKIPVVAEIKFDVDDLFD